MHIENSSEPEAVGVQEKTASQFLTQRRVGGSLVGSTGGRWYGESKPLPSRNLRMLGLLLIAGTVAFLLIISTDRIRNHSVADLLRVLIFGSLGLISYLPVFRRPVGPSIETELEDGNDSVAVTVQILQEGLLTGTDRGALFLDGERLCFVGRCMSFALGPGDADSSESPMMLATSVDPLPVLYLKHPSRSVRVVLAPISNRHHVEAKRLRDMKNEFLAMRGRSKESGQLPPLQIAPWIWKEFPLSHRSRNGLAGATLLLVACAVWGFVSASPEVAILSTIYVFLFACVWIFAIRQHALFSRIESELKS